MRRGLFLLFALIFLSENVAAQVSVSRVLADTDMRDYKWSIGYGATIEEADQDAIRLLSEMAGISISNKTNTSVVDSTVAGVSGESFVSNVNRVSSTYLENMRREVLSDDNGGRKRVLRYIAIADWNARHESLRGKIEEYIDSGLYAPLVEDKIRYYAWAHTLIQTYPGGEDQIKVEGEHPARQWLLSQLREILGKIDVRVIAVEQDKQNRNYPYKLFLDFTYDNEPISYLKFGYFDGGGYVEGESIKDGRGTIFMKQLLDEFDVDIDCLNRDLARQMDPQVSLLLENALQLEGANKKVLSKPEGVKPRKEVVTTAESVESPVLNKLAEVEKNYVEINSKVSDTAPFTKIMTDIVGSIQGLSTSDIQHHFTPDAWKHYNAIVASGNPVVARTPEYKFVKHDSLVICRSVPLKLKFKGNHSFVEDVVFRVNERTHKVESVAYRLGSKTEQTILSMEWEDAARLALLCFLEDYRSAYCLKDLAYINKVFADDAYIIVGRVLKQTTKKFSDTVSALQGVQTEYQRKSKGQYIADLRNSFNSKEFVNIRFEECNVAKGFYAKEGIYAVQVRQLYYSNNYADDGILTLAIDMRNDTNPLVRVRVWQQARDVTYDAEQMIERTVSSSGGLN